MIEIENVEKDVEYSQKTKYHRGKSWEHCYAFFRDYKKFRGDNNPLIDGAAVRLFAFLGSWGMLRGSSFLLQRDYKFCTPIVRILIDSNYDALWNCDSDEKLKNNTGLLFNLNNELRETIRKENREVGDDKEHATELIITKSIMATMGCVPAYDQFFKKGIREKWGKGFGSFSEESFIKLIEKVKNDEELNKVYRIALPIKENKEIEYPPMKLLDLYFWLLGGGKDEEERLKAQK